MHTSRTDASSHYAALPRGPVHADLFRDNVMFEGDTLTGFFDFYFADVDTWLFDIAVSLNDWCIDLATGARHAERERAFLPIFRSDKKKGQRLALASRNKHIFTVVPLDATQFRIKRQCLVWFYLLA
jgi:aminoglycoside phosphotransferase (APT) family kinase protein